jgi:hypothetical protein
MPVPGERSRSVTSTGWWPGLLRATPDLIPPTLADYAVRRAGIHRQPPRCAGLCAGSWSDLEAVRSDLRSVVMRFSVLTIRVER